MKRQKLFLSFLILVFFSFHSFCQQWDLKKDSEGVKIYTRDVKGSGVQEFRGEVTAKSNLGCIMAVIDNIADYPKWMYKCTYAERIEKKSKGSGYTYSVLQQSWPVTDRDICTFYTVVQDSITKIITITLKSAKDYVPEKPDKVRIPKMSGFWQLIPVAKGVTKIVYQVHCESGGYIPASIINAYITDTPYYNLLNLKKIVESPLFHNKGLENVKEL